MSKQYFPSNSSEGLIFQTLFCEKCYKYSSCSILRNSMFGKEPKQWIYDDNDEPTCTSFASERPKKKQLKPISNLFKSADVNMQGECDACVPISGFYLGTTCPKCKNVFRIVNQKSADVKVQGE